MENGKKPNVTTSILKININKDKKKISKNKRHFLFFHEKS